jgi:hypothetical protein
MPRLMLERQKEAARPFGPIQREWNLGIGPNSKDLDIKLEASKVEIRKVFNSKTGIPSPPNSIIQTW